MGWGLIINNVYLNKVTKEQLPELKEECKEDILKIKERLMILAASSPRMVEEMDWTDYVQREVSNLVEELSELVVKQHLSEIALDNPEDVTSD